MSRFRSPLLFFVFGQIIPLTLALLSLIIVYLFDTIGVQTPGVLILVAYFSIFVLYNLLPRVYRVFCCSRQAASSLSRGHCLSPWPNLPGRPILLYVGLATLDTLGNLLLNFSFELTSLLSVVLINSASLPLAMMFSLGWLGRRFTAGQVCGAALALLGMGLLILNDYLLGRDSEAPVGDNPVSAVLGDLLALSGAISFASSNTLQEYIFQQRADGFLARQAAHCLRCLGLQQPPPPPPLEEPPPTPLHSPERPTIQHASVSDSPRSTSPDQGSVTPEKHLSATMLSDMSHAETRTLSDPAQAGPDDQDALPPDSDAEPQPATDLSSNLYILSMLGLLSTLFSIPIVVITEYRSLGNLLGLDPGDGRILTGGERLQAWVFLGLYGVVFNLFYFAATFLFKLASAAHFNILLLLSNFYAAAAGILFFHTSITLLYVLAIIALAAGNGIYFLSEEPHPANTQQTTDQTSANLDPADSQSGSDPPSRPSRLSEA